MQEQPKRQPNSEDKGPTGPEQGGRNLVKELALEALQAESPPSPQTGWKALWAIALRLDQLVELEQLKLRVRLKELEGDRKGSEDELRRKLGFP